jgi:Spy/CpxP family protein refolding chaperone
MQLRTILAALTAVTLSAASFSAVAQTSSARPPTPKPAAGALPQTNPNAVQKSFRTQNASEQQSSAQSTTPVEIGQSGRSRQPN